MLLLKVLSVCMSYHKLYVDTDYMDVSAGDHDTQGGREELLLGGICGLLDAPPSGGQAGEEVHAQIAEQPLATSTFVPSQQICGGRSRTEGRVCKGTARDEGVACGVVAARNSPGSTCRTSPRRRRERELSLLLEAHLHQPCSSSATRARKRTVHRLATVWPDAKRRAKRCWLEASTSECSAAEEAARPGAVSRRKGYADCGSLEAGADGAP